MLRAEQSIFPHDAEFVKLDVMQEHIDAAEVVSGQVDLLPIEATLDIVLAQQFFHLQQQGAGTAGWIIDLVDLRFADGAEAGQQLRNIGGSEILTALFTGIGGIHSHQIFVGITKQVGIDAISREQRHLRYAVQQLYQHLVALGNSFANCLAVHIEIVKQTCKIILSVSAGGTAFNVVEYSLHRLVQVVVLVRTGKNIAEQLRGQNEKAFFLHQSLTGSLRLGVRHFGVVKVLISGGVLALVDIGGEVLRNIAVKHRAQHIRFEVPLRHMTCVNKVGGNFIDAAEQLVPLLVFLYISHCNYSFWAIHAASISSKGMLFSSQKALIFFIAAMFGLVLAFSQRFIVPTDTFSAFAKSSCDNRAFLRMTRINSLKGVIKQFSFQKINSIIL